MELDKKIIDGKKPLDCFDIEIAKQFIGKKGYFSNYLNVYTNLCNMEEGVLHSLDEQHGEAFVEEYAKWKFFLPAEWVKEPEKEYKVFSLEKFLEIFTVGDLIIYRENGSTEVHHKMFTGYIVCADGRYDIPGVGRITLGKNTYGLSYLFNTYELFLNGKWQPFGIEG